MTRSRFRESQGGLERRLPPTLAIAPFVETTAGSAPSRFTYRAPVFQQLPEPSAEVLPLPVCRSSSRRGENRSGSILCTIIISRALHSNTPQDWSPNGVDRHCQWALAHDISHRHATCEVQPHATLPISYNGHSSITICTVLGDCFPKAEFRWNEMATMC